MPRAKSQAIHKSARLNPIHQHEAAVIKIIAELEQEGFNFKEIIVDAILAQSGKRPEMFDREPNIQLIINRTLEAQQKQLRGMLEGMLMGLRGRGTLPADFSDEAIAQEVDNYTLALGQGLLDSEDA